MSKVAAVDVPDGLRWAELAHKHPFGVWPRKVGAMTVVRGSGLLSQVVEHGLEAVSCVDASSPGVCDRPWRLWWSDFIEPPAVLAGSERHTGGE